MTETIEEMIMRHEGLRLFPYYCSAGKLTIGVGRNIDDNGITKGEALLMLNNDIAACKNDLNKCSWYTAQNEIRKNVLIDMRFNLGMSGLLGFKKMIEALESNDHKKAAVEMLDSKWALDVGDRAVELARLMDEGKEGEEF